jgi:hypothetical protein
MGKYKTQFEYLALIFAFLLPALAATQAYKIIKNRKINFFDIILFIILVVTMIAAYAYLPSSQRYQTMAFVGVLLLAMLVVSGLMKLFG